MTKKFSEYVNSFQGIPLPEKGILAGYVALINAFNLKAPSPQIKMAIGTKHKIFKTNDWHFLTPRHKPEASLKGHLEFALKYEGVNLCIMKKLFETVDKKEIESIIKENPFGSYSRRIWFFYEWLMQVPLNIPDLKRGNYVYAIDPSQQVTIEGVNSTRHKVKNNLIGTVEFCPLIYRNKNIESYLNSDFKDKALQLFSNLPQDLLNRAAASLLLKDSRASFFIEKEEPSFYRIDNWKNVIKEAGKNNLSKEELIRLQRIVISNNRFIKTGFRKEGGFIGEHDIETRQPLVEHFSAKSEDLDSLINGLIKYNERGKHQIDPILLAAIISFGFVNIHPFSDGNGRIHRYLIHHILAENNFTLPGLIFPISSTMLNHISRYHDVLKNYSASIFPFIEWEPTEDCNVKVLNETVDYYRYFDATPYAIFLFECIKYSIEEELPKETQLLVKFDKFKTKVQNQIEIPDKKITLLFSFLSSNGGKISKRGTEKEFNKLTKEEINFIENSYKNIFII
jgi:Fic family protein